MTAKLNTARRLKAGLGAVGGAGGRPRDLDVRGSLASLKNLEAPAASLKESLLGDMTFVGVTASDAFSREPPTEDASTALSGEE